MKNVVRKEERRTRAENNTADKAPIATVNDTYQGAVERDK
jgi:hypothetical protein